MKSPFKFLDSYSKDDRDIFFGRDREIEELYQRIFESKLMLVYGVSGTGKSSLIHCGLANKFLDTDWLPLVIRRGANIINSMAGAIQAATITKQEGQFTTPAHFKKAVRSLYLDHYKPVFFIFDQFEELFIFGDKEERKSFVHIIKSLIESDLQCRLIFIMREEYMAGVTEFERYIPTFFANRVRIEKMSHVNALEAIKEPCKVFNISLEEGFAEILLEKLSPGSTEVELTYLQVFLDRIFRLAAEFLSPLGSLSRDSGRESKGGSLPARKELKGGLSFTLGLLLKTGNVSDLLGSFLDDQISLMDDPDTAMTVLKAFVSGKGTKRPANEQEAIDNIRSFGKKISPETVKELIQAFVKLRVLRDKDDNGRYELRHDALAEKVYEKFSTAEKELLEIRQFIENAYQSYLKRIILLSNEDLNYISNKDSLLNLNPDLKSFLDESRRHQKARLKTIKRLIIISAFAFIILLSTLAYTLIKRTRVSESVLYAKESISQFTRPIDRLCLAAAAWDTYKNEDAKEALLKAFNNLIRHPGEDDDFKKLRQEYFKEFRSISSPIEFAECSKDNRFIYGYSKDSVFIWKNDGDLLSGFSLGNSPIISLLMSDDGEYIGAVSMDSILTVWDNKGDIRFTHKTGFNPVNPYQIFRFSKDNKIIAISDDKDAYLFDNKGIVLQSFDLHNGSVNAVDISGDGKFIATASSDKTINAWYMNSDQQRFDIYNTITAHSDTVWSVDFAKNNKYLLSTSADGKIRTSSINNNIVFDVQEEYIYTFSNEISFGYPFFSEFDESGTGIVIRSCDIKNNPETDFMAAIYVDIYYHFAQEGEINKFDYIRFSPDKKYFVYVYRDDISLISRALFRHSVYNLTNNYRLLQINGYKPFFSPDGKYLYSICDRHLESWFIDVETISGIALDYYSKWYKYL
jgi:WD40 repeat protein